MLIFKPRLAAFYVLLLVVFALLSNRLAVSTPSAVAAPPSADSNNSK